MHLSKILVTTDFSEASSVAFPFARQHAVLSNSSLTLLNIVESIQFCMDLEGHLTPHMLIEKVEEIARKKAQEKLKETEDIYFAECSVKRVVLNTFQDISRGICNYAAENKHDLIVMGSQGKGFFKRIFPGSTAAQLSRISDCPVLVVPFSEMTANKKCNQTDLRFFGNILVTTDFTEDSKNAFKYALFEAKANNAKLSVAYVYEQLMMPDVPDLYTDMPEYSKFEQDYIAALDDKLKAFVRHNIDLKSVATIALEKVYSIAYTVSEYLRKNKFDLLVISTHGAGPAIKLIGGVVEEVLKLSACPVLVVPKTAAKK